MEEKVKEIMGDILQISPEAIDYSTSIENTAGWDSLNHINLIAALEQEFGVTFEVQEIESMSSVESILEVLSAKQVN